jgi:hypothetical protein
MMRFAGDKPDGTRVIGLGITSANVARMAQGEPIIVNTEQFGLADVKIEFMIFYGRTLEELNQQFAPLIGPNTQIHQDPLLAAGVPEDARTKRDGTHRGKTE